MPTAALRIIPVDKIPDWIAASNQGEDADGLGVNVDVFSIDDLDRPRTTVTHKLSSSIPNAAQLAWLQSAGAPTPEGYVNLAAIDPNPPSLAGCIVKLWTIPGANPQVGILAAEGLTTNPNFEP